MRVPSRDDVPRASNYADLPDGGLLELVHEGSTHAFDEIVRRHYPTALATARAFSTNLDPEELAQESFARFLRTLRNGRGPVGEIRPYLNQVVRNTARTWSTRTHPVDTALDAMQELERDRVIGTEGEPSEQVADGLILTRALRALPERWRRVLWYVDVEGETPAAVATQLQMSPNAVSALLYRARAGLRVEWLRASVGLERLEAECQEALRTLTLQLASRGQRASAQIGPSETHIAACDTCPALVSELDGLSRRLPANVAPLLATLGAGSFATTVTTDSVNLALPTSAPPGIGMAGALSSKMIAAALVASAVVGSAAVGASLMHRSTEPIATTTASTPESFVIGSSEPSGGDTGPVAPSAEAPASESESESDRGGRTERSAAPASDQVAPEDVPEHAAPAQALPPSEGTEEPPGEVGEEGSRGARSATAGVEPPNDGTGRPTPGATLIISEPLSGTVPSTFTVAGRSVPGSQVLVSARGQEPDQFFATTSAVTDHQGNWTIQFSLPDGTYTLSAESGEPGTPASPGVEVSVSCSLPTGTTDPSGLCAGSNW